MILYAPGPCRCHNEVDQAARIGDPMIERDVTMRPNCASCVCPAFVIRQRLRCTRVPICAIE